VGIHHDLPSVRGRHRQASLQLMHPTLVVIRRFLFKASKSPVLSRSQDNERAVVQVACISGFGATVGE
jgi:hypothetical protein